MEYRIWNLEFGIELKFTIYKLQIIPLVRSLKARLSAPHSLRFISQALLTLELLRP
jgi:hypothetical protein